LPGLPGIFLCESLSLIPFESIARFKQIESEAFFLLLVLRKKSCGQRIKNILKYGFEEFRRWKLRTNLHSSMTKDGRKFSPMTSEGFNTVRNITETL
jgi:hypothetical protein